ncbi:MAG: hypothetical protein K0M45_03850 [Candidatus Paracaedibacteraceae bacterium]|nr:hypothetical protein [Candidatus Paracaedibacteraceae bacterium]
MKILRSLNITFSLCFSLATLIRAQETIREDELVVRVHSVGQGNCITINFHNKVMMVDCGTSSIKNESLVRKDLVKDAVKKLQEEEEGKKKGKGKKKEASKRERTSVESPSDLFERIAKLDRDRVNSGEPELKAKVFKDQCCREINQVLLKYSPQDKSDPGLKRIKTILLTHGDTDHTNLLTTVVKKKYKINNFILGGMPEEYDLDEKWIDYHLKLKGFKLYIPALSFKAFGETWSWTQIIALSKELREKNGLAPQAYSFPKGSIRIRTQYLAADFEGYSIKELEKAFNFGGKFQVYLLSINSAHFQGAPLSLEDDKTSILRVNEDPNTDSLVLKIIHTPSNLSVMLTGDATGQTTDRIYNNYQRFLPTEEFKDFLQADIYLAAHHGSITHGSNHEDWIKNVVKPQVVFISNGLSQGHPYKQAFQIFKGSPNMKTGVQEHKVDYAIHKKEQASTSKSFTYKTYMTKAAIFSTVNNGLLEARFSSQEGILNIGDQEEKIPPIMISKDIPNASVQAPPSPQKLSSKKKKGK